MDRGRDSIDFESSLRVLEVAGKKVFKAVVPGCSYPGAFCDSAEDPVRVGLEIHNVSRHDW